MKLTMIEVGATPAALLERFPTYPEMFQKMFDAAGAGFEVEGVRVMDGAPFPDPETLEGIIVPGSAAGVYETHPWMEPLRAFIRKAYAARTPMLGVCFGHQAMADALGGDVRKSEKGWGIGRHVYRVTSRPAFMEDAGDSYAILASHQDQVVTPPKDAKVFLASDFTPNAGLVYANGAALSLQPHPEFEPAFARELAEMRRGIAHSDADLEAAERSLGLPLDRLEMTGNLARFFRAA